MDLGFDKRSIYRDLVFALPMKEGTGTTLYDYAKSSLRHTMTATGTPTWTALANGFQVLDFNSAHPDYLQCSAAGSTDLNFTSGAFSGCCWVYFDSVASTSMIISRGLANTDGWYFILDSATTKIRLTTLQAGAGQDSYGSIISISTWYFASFTRVGTSVRIYINGIDRTSVIATHTNPLTANRKLLIGIYNDEVQTPFDGKLFFPRIWSRALSPEEIMYLFQTERKLLGV